MHSVQQASLFDAPPPDAAAAAEPARPSSARGTSPAARPPGKSALGLTVGDWVQRGDRTGPAAEIVSIWGPYWWHSDYHGVYCHGSPIIGLTLQKPGVDPGDRPIVTFMNEIQRVGDRWLVGYGAVVGGSPYFGPQVHPQGMFSELVVVRRGAREPGPAQAALLDDPSPWTEPYPRVPGVRYDGGEGSVWTCVTGRGLGWPEGQRCCDFNAVAPYPRCPTCGKGGTRRIYVFARPSGDEAVRR